MGLRASSAIPDRPRSFRAGARSRRYVELLILLLIVALAIRTWLIEGLVFPLVVASSSMAPGLAGPHHAVVCGTCGSTFLCGSRSDRLTSRAVCPNCGFAENDLAALPVCPGDRVLVDKSAYWRRGPRRWEVVVVRDPDEPSQESIKRVVGLPGESIQIRRGDVYADGRIQRKDLGQQRAMALLVYDGAHPPTAAPTLPARWQADPARTAWHEGRGRFIHLAARDPEAIDWLTYCHWRRKPGAPGEAEPVPVSDDCSYDPSQPRRVEDVHPVTDLLLSFRVSELSGSGKLWIRASDGREEFRLSLHPAGGRSMLLRDGRPVAEGHWMRLGGATVEFSLFDQQVLLAIDGRMMLEYPYVPRNASPAPNCRPVAIGCQALAVQLTEVRLYRDVYYTHPIGADGRWGLDEPASLRPQEYFLLGDNSPVSRDSRVWPSGPGVAAKWLVGNAFLAYPSTTRLTPNGRQFHVPDLSRMRYIR